MIARLRYTHGSGNIMSGTGPVADTRLPHRFNDPDQRMSCRQMQNYWYHWMMGFNRGAELIWNDRQRFMLYIWSIWNLE